MEELNRRVKIALMGLVYPLFVVGAAVIILGIYMSILEVRISGGVILGASLLLAVLLIRPYS